MRRTVPTVGVAGIAVFAVAIATLALGCKGRDRGARIEALRDALTKDDAAAIDGAVSGLPSCADAPPVALMPSQPSPRDAACFGEIANELGSKKGFSRFALDQSSLATAAVVLLRDRRGDWLAHPDLWLGALKSGKGSGADALRLAVARRMSEAAPLVGRRIEEEREANEAMKAVAGAIPGACATYALLGAGTAPTALASEHSAEHAACVHRDLARREGPGARYGAGTFRALEGSLALWRETERALRLGLGAADERTRHVVEAKLTGIEAATQAIATKKLPPSSTSSAIGYFGELHADAGIMLWNNGDGGADGGADGGPRAGADGGARSADAAAGAVRGAAQSKGR